MSDAERLAEEALAGMREHGIPAIPDNYTVWYHYCANTYPDLKRTVDILIDNGQEFSPSVCANLFERFFTNSDETKTLRSATSKLEGVIKRAFEYLNEAGEGAAQFGEHLADASGALAESTPDNEALEIIQGIIDASQQMEVRTRDLETRLASTSGEVVQLRKEIEITRREASTDSLTGLANRKLFDLTIREAAAHAMESGDTMCLLMLDIDHFKKFNDNYGHQTGDKVLKLLALVLTESIKGQDTAARYGGEEFVVVLPETKLDDALAVGELIRDRIAKKNIVNRTTGKKLGGITLSVGAAKFVPGEALTELIERADTALYIAKQTGRNRVVSEKDIPQEQVAVGG
ncbi:MAG: GGDEF domain-containing protein [Rhodospirillales bacterium]|jgi:diguanylate cyclase|nr:GGDEF domain-containing protein [Rhodospirillaceae bacterium]MDP6429847.1 GGDEF domain-containing protein [Rhodospirillales bacterium]MDP6643064.1 GGDEF domain-containing protein [Rhodospirillales bacterium]MDP6841028.1 GGDEF domain-containing protein [Rhodospirillales bacterium]|tara:strand:- start:431 stop:1471 length:1041 start_codon:yes stop_codon:yes gene_type:complete